VAGLCAAGLKDAEPSAVTDLRAAAIDAVNGVLPLVSGFATQLGAMRKAIFKAASPGADKIEIMDMQEQVEKDLDKLLQQVAQQDAAAVTSAGAATSTHLPLKVGAEPYSAGGPFGTPPRLKGSLFVVQRKAAKEAIGSPSQVREG
jgi:hypothetical protein